MEGTQLSTYRIVSELGSGGMGKVYRAEVAAEAAGLEPGMAVALKVIHPHLLETPGFFKRFLREAQIGQQVQHENVVRTFDCDATLQDGVQQNFLVMEYVEGQTLRDLLDELERVPEELCRHVGREIAKGLAAIHEVGVVHRDIKPENVLITEEHVVKVMDLGVAHLQDEVIRLSQAGGFVGSLEYAAPEQIQSQGDDLDGRADLFALGALLYEIATGLHPFRDEDVRKVLRNVLDANPRKPGEVNPQLSPFIEEVVTTLLAKDRDGRFATAVQLADVLDEGEQSGWWKERAKALRIQTKQPLRRIRIPRETALYGRDDDLAKLKALFDKAKAGDGQVLLVEGEAGIGKTRLVDEFIGRLRQEGEDINFLFGSYPPGGAATASGAFSTAYREQFGDVGLEETLGAYLPQTPLLVPAFAALLTGDAAPKDAEPLTKDSLQTVFAHATRALAEERPTVVLIDDLHFAPEDGRALFASLAMAAPGHRFLLVGTTRPGISEAWAANLERTGHFSRVGLSRLGPKDLMGLLHDSFRSERLAQELGHQIAIKSDGNPFFAFEIIRGLREGQFITQEADGTWVSTKVIQDIQIPSSVLDLVNARVADLSEEERDLLDVASCCGFEFDPGLIGDVLGLGRIPLLKRFGQIERAHRLVRSSGRNYVFDHHQVQEALYGSLHEQMREEYHAAIAEALETREKAADKDPKDLDGALCVDLCEHYLKGAQGERALRYLDAALDHLQAGYLSDQMITLANRALESHDLLEGGARAEILLTLDAALDLLGRRDEQEMVLNEAGSLVKADGDDVLQARVHIARGRLLSYTARYEPALEQAEAACSLAQRAGAATEEANALALAGGTLLGLSRYEEAIERIDAARALFEAHSDRRGEASAIGKLGVARYYQGRHEEAETDFQCQLEMLRDLECHSMESNARGNLGLVYQAQGKNVEARAEQERALLLARETGDRYGEAVRMANLAGTFSFEGYSAEALKRHARAREVAREVGHRQGAIISLYNEGCDLARLGALQEARSRLEAAVGKAEGIGFVLLEATSLATLADVLLEQGDRDQAETRYQQALALFEALGTRNQNAATAELSYGGLLARSGRVDDARPHLRAALSIATEAGLPGHRLTVLLQIALMDGSDAKEALAAFDQVEGRSAHGTRVEARFLLYQLTGDKQHLEAARDLLMFFVEHAPEEYRETTLIHNRVHRDIMAAWNEQAGS